MGDSQTVFAPVATDESSLLMVKAAIMQGSLLLVCVLLYRHTGSGTRELKRSVGE